MYKQFAIPESVEPDVGQVIGDYLNVLMFLPHLATLDTPLQKVGLISDQAYREVGGDVSITRFSTPLHRKRRQMEVAAEEGSG
jgi:hypothetical protein